MCHSCISAFFCFIAPLRWIDDALHFLFERLYLVLELEWLNIERIDCQIFLVFFFKLF